MNLIVGQDNFGKAIQKQQHFIDKSLFIKAVFDKSETEVDVILRPRRFGKTFNMSMLHHFLAEEINGYKTHGMFDDLLIAQQGDAYMQHQGQYPVIFVSFKGLKYSSFEETYAGLAELISKLYREHHELLSGSTLYDHERALFDDILNQRASYTTLVSSLENLSGYLYKHYQVKPWILIDEYDTPIQAGYLNNHYPQIIQFMRGLFGNALKGNPYLHRAVVTGILRIAKEDLFSGLNNVAVYSVLDAEYANYFGFTESEVDATLQTNNLQHLSDKIKAWYNGYRIGNTHVYNPWSIARCVNKNGSLQSYWVNTSGNDLIKRTMARASSGIKTQFGTLLEGGSITADINEHMTFAHLDTNEDALWSLLLFAGYLTPLHNESTGFYHHCLLTTPNQEISLLYHAIVSEWFSEASNKTEYHALLDSLIAGRTEEFLEILQKFLSHAASYFDVAGDEPERFYHGLVMGLMVSLSQTHQVQSNKESGYGRYDVLLIPKDPQQLGIIIEFKVAKSAELLQTTAQDALKQIQEKNYAAELQHKGIQHITKMGLAFYRKEVAMALP